MEALYLLFSIISTSVTSLALSLLLFFRTLLARHVPSRASYSSANAEPVALYEGTVYHERRRPVQHSFRYSVRYALIDLDNASADQVPPDHLSADEARNFSGTSGQVFLLTIPPSVGYEQNPLSVYYCYDSEGSNQLLKKCIAEVTNTPWGERVKFVFEPQSDLVAKPLHVSPFMDMLGSWNIKANAPAESLFITISVEHPELGNYFTATLRAKRVSYISAIDAAVFFWLMPHKVAVWIYWHALKLWWKNVCFIQHPRYCIPAYKQEAIARDQKLQFCPAFDLTKDNHQVEGSNSVSVAHGSNRMFVWRDAKVNGRESTAEAERKRERKYCLC